MRSSPLKRRAPLRRSSLRRRKPRPAKFVPIEIVRAAQGRSGGRCIVCGLPALGPPHHVLPKERWPQFRCEVANLVAVCLPCHDRHESGFRRIRRRELHADVVAFVVAVGQERYLERYYP